MGENLKNDLVAAKALIDTPAKCAARDIYGALRGIDEEAGERFLAMQDALRKQLPRRSDRLSTFYRPGRFRAVMALFNRAIRAAASPDTASVVSEDQREDS